MAIVDKGPRARAAAAARYAVLAAGALLFVLPFYLLLRNALMTEAQITAPSCYACSDGRFDSYTRSVRLRTEPTAPLVPYAVLPRVIARFLASHPEWTAYGYSSAVP